MAERPTTPFAEFVAASRQAKSMGLPIPKVEEHAPPDAGEGRGAPRAPRGGDEARRSTPRSGAAAPKATPRAPPSPPLGLPPVGAQGVSFASPAPSKPPSSAGGGKPPRAPRPHADAPEPPLAALGTAAGPAHANAGPQPHVTRPGSRARNATSPPWARDATAPAPPPEPSPTSDPLDLAIGSNPHAARPGSSGRVSTPKFSPTMPLPQQPAPAAGDPRRGPEMAPPPDTPFTDFTRRPQTTDSQGRMRRLNSRGLTPRSAGFSPYSEYSAALSTPPPIWTDYLWGKEDPTDMRVLFRDAMSRFDERRQVLNLEHEQGLEEKLDRMLPDKARPQTTNGIVGERYNVAVTSLKDRLMQKGPQALAAHFRALDLDQSGYLDRDEFIQAVCILDDRIDDVIGGMLMESIDADNSGSINYQEFVDALRFGRIPYHDRKDVPGQRWRMRPDPDLPMGQPYFPPVMDKKMRRSYDPKHGPTLDEKKLMSNNIPFGYMADAEANLEEFDRKANSVYQNVANIFQSFDRDRSGTVDYNEFREAIQTIAPQLVTEVDILRMFKDADRNKNGEVAYNEFVEAFSLGKRFIPEFLKPRSNRRSQQGNAWNWHAEPKYKKEYDRLSVRPLVGKRDDVLSPLDEFETADDMRAEDAITDFGGHHLGHGPAELKKEEFSHARKSSELR